jgi:N-formylglutamate deformylase
MGITVISSVYSRWVIDLNRDPQNKPLYTDGRIITSLCPATNFLGEPLYIDRRESISAQEVNRRLTNYYWPYHNELVRLLTVLKSEFGQALIWEAHSIRQVVRTISKEKFPDLILGDVNVTSASKGIIEAASQSLLSSTYTVSHNDPFMGGFITREYGKPEDNQHALQLEMTKVNYMDDTETQYDENRAERMKILLQGTLSTIAGLLTNNV